MHRLTVIGSGLGSITLVGQVDTAQLRALVQVDVDASALTVGDATVYAQNAGGVRLSVTGKAAITNAGPGGVAVTGPAQCTIKGSAPVTCEGAENQ